MIDIDYFLTLVGPRKGEALVRRAGLARNGGPLPASLEFATFWRLCTENIQANNDKSHGVAREPVPRGSISVLVLSAKEADTLGEALARFVDAAQLVRKDCVLVLGESRDAVHFTVKPAAKSTRRSEIYVECFALVAHCAFRWMTGSRLTPQGVRGSGKLRESDNALLGCFHAPMARRGGGVTIHYAKPDVNAPVLKQKYSAWGDQEFESFLALLQEHDTPSQSGQLPETWSRVAKLLRAGFKSQDEIARELHCSVATLRRKLGAEGTSFRALFAEIRRTELKGMLATEIAIADIGEKLGLSDDRSLRRFCRSNLGVSPRQYRQFLRNTPPEPAARIRPASRTQTSRQRG